MVGLIKPARNSLDSPLEVKLPSQKCPPQRIFFIFMNKSGVFLEVCNTMMWSAHSSTIVGSALALKCRCDLGDQSEQPFLYAVTF